MIIVKSEKKSDKVLDKNIDFNVYEPYNRSQLNLSLCDENSFNLLIPFELNIEIQQLYEQIKKLGYNMFDIKDPFYQDICTPYDSSDGTDILISDRINYFYNNDNVKCQQNCKFSNYSVEFHYLKCSCSESSNNESELFERKVKLESKKMYERFYEVLKYPNVKIIKCYNILFNINTVTKNIGNILVIVCFFCYFVCLIFYIFFGLSPLKKKIKKEMKKKNIHLKSDIKKLLYPPIRRITTNNLTIRDDIKKKKTNKNKRKKNKGKKNKFDNKINSELYEFEYKEAIKLDKRTLLQIYWDHLKREHILIFSFIKCNDYNLLFVKLTRFIFIIVTDMAFNAFFFSNESIHKLYLNHGKYDFFEQIPQITYSIIITQIIEIFLCFLSMTDRHFYLLKTYIIAENKKEIKKIIKYINIKLIFFYIFIFIFS